MTATAGLLSKPAYFLHWGVVQISLANVVVLAVMLLLFVLALVVPFPHGHDDPDGRPDSDDHK